MKYLFTILAFFASSSSIWGQTLEKFFGGGLDRGDGVICAENRDLSKQEDLYYKNTLTPKKVVITNNNNKKIFFQLAYPAGAWSVHEIEPGYVHTYNLLSFDRINIKIRTNGKDVEYYLTGGERYEIKWNATKSIWDLYNISID